MKTSVDRSNRPEVRNPVLALPEVAQLHELPEEAKAALRSVLTGISKASHANAEASWKRRKAPMAAYFRACGVYATHIARAIGKAPRKWMPRPAIDPHAELDRSVRRLREVYASDALLDGLQEAIEDVLDAYEVVNRSEGCHLRSVRGRLDGALASLGDVVGAEFYEGRSEALEASAAAVCEAYTELERPSQTALT